MGSQSEATEQRDFISMKELHEIHPKMTTGELILDVRSPEEFAEGHVPGSRNIPHEDVRKFVDDLKHYKKIYVHCKAGGRAKRAFETLNALGLSNLICVAGSGMDDWTKAGYPIVKNK